jgi:WD40 repeat protein
MTTDASSNPYVGPRPFSMRERHMFFGRERESNALIPLVISGRIVLFYAQSGAGKSSLINARLIPGLRERNFIVLPVARVSGHDAGNEPVDNIFIYNLLMNLQGGTARISPEGLAHMSLKDFLADLEILPASPEATIPLPETLPVDAPDVIEGVQPMALVIDQFEELFTTHPEAWGQRGPFFEQLCEAMEADPYLWVVLSIREDYVALLDPYAYLLPGRLQSRFYMQRMGAQAALEAVKKPVEDVRPFAPGVAEKLVTNLSQIVVSRAGDTTVYAEGQYIEPVQLQVVCYQLWENLKAQTGERITEEDLNKLTGQSDLAEFVSRALGQFYEDAISSVLADPSVDVSERKLRSWFSYELVTEAETRGAIRQGADRTGSMPNNVVRLLQDKFIIRSETRGGNTWFELSHDRFVAPILHQNRAWRERHPRPILNDAEAWDQSGRDRALLYEGTQLQAGLKELQAKPNEFGDIERDFLRAGQAAAESHRARRQRILMAFFGLALLVMAFLVAFATVNARDANFARATAVYQRSIVEDQKFTAVAAEANAAQERDRAVTAEAAAQVDRNKALEAQATSQAGQATAIAAGEEEARQRQVAQDAQKLAEENAQKAKIAQNEAEAGRLASLSDYFRDTQTDLSLLLSVAAFHLSDTWETRRGLLDGVQRGLEVDISQDGAPQYFDKGPNASAISPDGSRYAIGMNDGTVLVPNSEGGGRAFNVPDDFNAKDQILSLAFDSTGQYLARSSGDAIVPLLDLQTQKVAKVIRPFGTTYSNITSLAFQPGGTLLAMATNKEPGSGKGLVFIYDYQKDLPYFTWDCGPNNCLTLAWSQDGTKLAVGNSIGTLQVLDVVKKQEIMNQPRAHQDDITGLEWYPDGQRLVSAGLDQRIIQWDPARRTILRQTVRNETPIILDMSMSVDGRYLLIGRTNLTGGISTTNKPVGVDALPWVTLWDAETLQPMDNLNKKLFALTQAVGLVNFSPAGDRFLTVSTDRYVTIWKFEPVDPISTVMQTLKSAILALVEDAGKLVYAQTPYSGQVTVATEGADKTTSISATPAGLVFGVLDGKKVLVSGDFNGKVFFYDPVTGQEVQPSIQAAKGTIQQVALSPDGQRLAVAFCQGQAKCDLLSVRDLKANTEEQPDLSSLSLGLITGLTFSPDGNLLAIGSSEGKIIFYHLDSKVLEPLVTEGLAQRGTKLQITSVAFSPADANMFAAGLFGGRVGLWKVDSRGPIGDLSERANGDVTSIIFRRQAETNTWIMVTGSSRGEIRVWDIDPAALMDRACKIARRDVTPEERSKFLPDSDPSQPICK